MATILLMKTPQGYLIPLDADEAEKLKRFKVGATVEAKVSAPQNPMFHRKMLSLFRLCYETFEENQTAGIEYRGMLVKSSFDRFRKDLVIMAGYFDPVFNIKSEMRVEAQSISYAKCDQETAEKIYSDVINAALKYVYKNRRDEAWLRNTVDQFMAYA